MLHSLVDIRCCSRFCCQTCLSVILNGGRRGFRCLYSLGILLWCLVILQLLSLLVLHSSNLVGGRDGVDERCTGPFTRLSPLVYFRRPLRRDPFLTTDCMRIPDNGLWYWELRLIGGGTSHISVIWPPSGRRAWFLTDNCGFIRLFLLEENNTKIRCDYGTSLQCVNCI